MAWTCSSLGPSMAREGDTPAENSHIAVESPSKSLWSRNGTGDVLASNKCMSRLGFFYDRRHRKQRSSLSARASVSMGTQSNDTGTVPLYSLSERGSRILNDLRDGYSEHSSQWLSRVGSLFAYKRNAKGTADTDIPIQSTGAIRPSIGLPQVVRLSNIMMSLHAREFFLMPRLLRPLANFFVIWCVAVHLVRAATAQSPHPTQPPVVTSDASSAASGPSQITNSLGMQLALLPAGEFMMGNPSIEKSVASIRDYTQRHRKNLMMLSSTISQDIQHEHPQHRVRIAVPFFIGIYHVTVGQFRQFVADSGYQTEAETSGRSVEFFDKEAKDFGHYYPANSRLANASNSNVSEFSWRNPGFDQTDDHPVVNVTWDDAMAFCRWLSDREGVDYRLPTEAEWEYACRAGTDTVYASGDTPDEIYRFANVADMTYALQLPKRYASFVTNDGYAFTSPVGQFQPNAFGLHDMHGNALQWCSDWFGPDYYGISPSDDPKGPSIGLHRVLRGSSFQGSLMDSRCTSRSMGRPNDLYSFRYDRGFRVAMNPEGPDAANSNSSPASHVIHPPSSNTGSELNTDRESIFSRDALAPSITNAIGIQLTHIPAGEFIMGGFEPVDYMAEWSQSTGDTFHCEHPLHRVRITRPFYLGTTPVTRGQFRQFVRASGYQTEAEKEPSQTSERTSWLQPGFDQTDDHPVVCVSWNDATEFCKWLSQREGAAYRLPTEAEWEYACRAGTTTSFFYGDDPEAMFEFGNIADATLNAQLPNRFPGIKASDGFVYTSPVASFQPNPFGIYDMHGNVQQWCSDWFDATNYASSRPDDPSGPDRGRDRVRRGSSWTHPPIDARCARRNQYGPPGSNYPYCGFRVARSE